MRADLAGFPEQCCDQQRAEPVLMLQRFDVLPRLPGDRRSQHGRHVVAAEPVDDGEPLGQPLVLVPVEIADQRPETVRQGLPRCRPVPCCVDVWAVRRARREIFARQQWAGAGQHGVDLRQFFGKSMLLVGVFEKVFVGVGVRPTGHRRGIESRASPPGARPVAALPFAAAQRQNANARKRPVGWVEKNAAPGAQHGVGPGELVGRSADVHVGVVQDEVFDMHELAVEPQRGRRVGKMQTLDKTVTDRAFVHPLVEPGQKVFGAGERPDQGGQGQVGKILSH